MQQETSRRAFLAIGAAAAGACVLSAKGLVAADAASKPTVVVWSEGTAPKDVYPHDINGAVAEGLRADLPDWNVVVANLDDPDQGMPDSLLAKCDVLIWWGHKRHDDVKNELVAKVDKRVKKDGMGFIALHSSHFARTNKKLMGSPCTWGAYIGDSIDCKITVKDATHPIAAGLPKEFTFKHSERYSEPYAVPEPQSVVLTGAHTLADGKEDPARMGLCWEVGKGKFYYFQPGHETNPVFFDANVRRMMANAVKWAAPSK